MRNDSAVPRVTAPPRAHVTYLNPIIDRDFPDPTIIRAADGLFYVYATQGGSPMVNIQVARSADLVHFEWLGDALPVKPCWASKTQDFWAPDVTRIGDQYVMYYSARPDAALDNPEVGLALAIAVAERPEGPFIDVGQPLIGGPGFVNIDPFFFEDADNGRRYLYWGSGFEPIKVRELAPDGLSFAPGCEAVDLVFPATTDDPADYRRLVEGVCVVKRGAYFYLFFSGDNCCGPDAHYAVMVARSRSPLGPFELSPRPRSLVVEANERWLAPGHNTALRDAEGEDWLVYHAIDRQAPGEPINTRRALLMDRLEWVDGWPIVGGLGPSMFPRRAPAVRG